LKRNEARNKHRNRRQKHHKNKNHNHNNDNDNNNQHRTKRPLLVPCSFEQERFQEPERFLQDSLYTFNDRKNSDDGDDDDLFTEEGYLCHQRRLKAVVLVQSIWRSRYDERYGGTDAHGPTD